MKQRKNKNKMNETMTANFTTMFVKYCVPITASATGGGTTNDKKQSDGTLSTAPEHL
jgi:hypothetical protein